MENKVVPSNLVLISCRSSDQNRRTLLLFPAVQPPQLIKEMMLEEEVGYHFVPHTHSQQARRQLRYQMKWVGGVATMLSNHHQFATTPIATWANRFSQLYGWAGPVCNSGIVLSLHHCQQWVMLVRYPDSPRLRNWFVNHGYESTWLASPSLALVNYG